MMHWIIQDNVFSEAGHQALLEALDRGGIPYTLVKFLPHTHKLVPYDLDFSLYDNVDEMPEITGPVVCMHPSQTLMEESPKVYTMVCGATLMNIVAKEWGWVPGTFLNDNFHYSRWVEGWGHNLLNAVAVVGPLGTLQIPFVDKVFIRPCEDTKAFTGLVLDRDEFEDWRSTLLSQGRDPRWLSPATEVMASPWQEILAEYRFFVVDKRIVTQSMYKLGLRVVYDEYVPPYVAEFAQKMIDQWQPARGFVIDIAETHEGPRVIEVNNLNSSGFYACNVGKIVEAIESMEF
jgi:hypothetical protein